MTCGRPNFGELGRQGLILSDTLGMLPAAFSGPLHISELPLPLGGTLGLVHCPGRQGPDSSGQRWSRTLSADLQQIKEFGATAVLTLVNTEELARMGVPQLPQAVVDAGLHWAHVPIPDFEPPNALSMRTWQAQMPKVHAALARQEKVVVHCAAGLGRTGTVAAMLLVLQGVPRDEAMVRVRQVRPGAIETPAQEAFIREFRTELFAESLTARATRA